MIALQDHPDGVVLTIRASPNAQDGGPRRTQSGIKVSVTSPPEDGKANAALTELLREFFGLKRSQVELIGGLTARKNRRCSAACRAGWLLKKLLRFDANIKRRDAERHRVVARLRQSVLLHFRKQRFVIRKLQDTGWQIRISVVLIARNRLAEARQQMREVKAIHSAEKPITRLGEFEDGDATTGPVTRAISASPRSVSVTLRSPNATQVI